MTFPKNIAVVAVVSTGLISGFFYAWVCSTMWGLDTLDPVVAIKAMNGMNESVRNGVFFPIFFLTPILLALAALVVFRTGAKKSALLFILAALIYGLFAFLPTALVNVPLNRELASLENIDGLSNAGAIWENYSQEWQAWNIGRTITSTCAFVFALIALLKLSDVGAEDSHF